MPTRSRHRLEQRGYKISHVANYSQALNRLHKGHTGPVIANLDQNRDVSAEVDKFLDETRERHITTIGISDRPASLDHTLTTQVDALVITPGPWDDLLREVAFACMDLEDHGLRCGITRIKVETLTYLSGGPHACEASAPSIRPGLTFRRLSNSENHAALHVRLPQDGRSGLRMAHWFSTVARCEQIKRVCRPVFHMDVRRLRRSVSRNSAQVVQGLSVSSPSLFDDPHFMRPPDKPEQGRRRSVFTADVVGFNQRSRPAGNAARQPGLTPEG